MSWAEENGYDAYDGEKYIADPLAFRDAIWITKNGEKYRIKDMTDSHLFNAYNKTIMADMHRAIMKEMTYRLFEERIKK